MRCGLLGEHLGHSYSPQIHASLGAYSYGLFEVAPSDLEKFLQNGDFDGLNVTIPYKKAVMPYCSELSETAKRMGCVNTLLRREDGSLYGDNTDFDGFLWLLARNGGIAEGEKALVLGSGGASGTVQAVLRSFGAEVIEVSRNGATNYVNYKTHADAVLLVNATPVGMYPNNLETLVDLSALPNLRCVLDLIYNPERTRLLLDAENRNIRCEGGLPMLVAQAKRASEIWTGEKIPDAICDEILCELSAQMRNIILIGMPGSGKSTLGMLLAQRLQRPFYDADTEIVKKIGPIPEFFAKHGEHAFRAVETEVLKDLGKKSACVIATGGGCVTRQENYPLLHQNGIIIRIDRELAVLPVDGRPVSQSTDLKTLFAKRDSLYAAFADITINNDASVEQTINIIMEAIK